MKNMCTLNFQTQIILVQQHVGHIVENEMEKGEHFEKEMSVQHLIL